MRSAATAFVSMFSIGNGRIRPARLERLIVSLLHTLSSHDLLDQAVEDIDNLTDLTSKDTSDLAYVDSISRTPEIVGLHHKDKALRLILKLLPHIKLTEQHARVTLDMTVVTGILNRKNKSHVHTEMKKILDDINELNLGYKVIQKPRHSAINEFHIVKYTSRDELLDILRANKLMHPSILDKVL